MDNDEHRETYENAVLKHELVDFNLDTRADIFDEGSLLRAPPKQSGNPPKRLPKSTQVQKEAKANPYTPKDGKPEAGGVAPKGGAPKPANSKKALPNSAKLAVNKVMRQELDEMGLHGKARKNVIKWHKNQIKKAMRTNPLLKGEAKTGVIK